MASPTQQQIKALRTLTRRANRRLERATPGQRSALEYYVKGYTGGAGKFSAAAKGLTYEEVALKLKNLDAFLGAKTSTRKGWDELKNENIKKANATLSERGYDFTDEELAEVFIQVGEGSLKEKYRAINLVEASKREKESKGIWEGSTDEIAKAIAQKATAQQALTKALKAREKYT